MQKVVDVFNSFFNGQKKRDNLISQIGQRNMEYDDSDPNNGLVLNSYFIPEEVLIRLLSFANPQELVRYRFVCKIWKDLIDCSEVWKLMSIRSDVASLSKFSAAERKMLISNYPWYLNYWILSGIPFEENLLRNNCGQEKLKYWAVTEPCTSRKLGDGYWDVEEKPIFTSNLPESTDFGTNTSCFATSYVTCRKHQKIDLSEKGFPGRILDEFQPPIKISEWYSGRFDCGSKYTLSVSLLNEKHQIIDTKKSVKKLRTQWQDEEWNKVSLTCDDYGRGLRYIIFEHEGCDTQFWAGNYGSKMSGGVVKISFPEVSTSNSEDQLPELSL